ncbi:MAG: hypothetical protein JW934_07435 [Anaerolineae bacterium]|nr:hypothetical protein [Anaerolineae bacterium]
MKHKIALIAMAVLLCGLLLAPAAQAQETSLVRGYLFYSATCPDCQRVRAEVIPPLYREFGTRLQIMAIEIGDPDNYEWWLACEQAYGVSENEADVPELFIGDQALVGAQAIEAGAQALIQSYMTQGGVDYPDVPRPGGPLLPTVRFMFFWSSTCGHCAYVKENVFPPLKEQYGERVQWESYSVENADNYLALLALEERMGMPGDQQGGVPVVFVGDEYSRYGLFVGSVDIPNNLPPAIEWFMTIGGVDLPGWHGELFGQLFAPPTATPVPTATAVPPSIIGECEDCREIKQAEHTRIAATVAPTSLPVDDALPIHMAYFAEVGCSECDRVSIALAQLQKRFPALVIHQLDIFNDLSLNLCLSERLNVPESQRHDAPAVFVGSDYLVDKDITYNRLVEMVSQYVESGAEATWETCSRAAAFPAPPLWWAVIVPGLIDGINPCAFATIIFFVSYLSIIRRKGKDVVMVGIAFTLAVFLSYLAFGLILRELIAGLVDLVGPVLRPTLNLLMAVFCLVLAVLGWGDYLKARQGRLQDATLQLPHKLRLWINARIRTGMRAEGLLAASFVSGVVVSFIELACTGQVYVPIIQGLSSPQHRGAAILDLVVYCLAFITPLIVVFILSYMGTTSQQLTRFLTRNAAPIKMAMAVLFLGIGIWLLYDTLRLWNLFAFWA